MVGGWPEVEYAGRLRTAGSATTTVERVEQRKLPEWHSYQATHI